MQNSRPFFRILEFARYGCTFFLTLTGIALLLVLFIYLFITLWPRFLPLHIPLPIEGQKWEKTRRFTVEATAMQVKGVSFIWRSGTTFPKTSHDQEWDPDSIMSYFSNYLSRDSWEDGYGNLLCPQFLPEAIFKDPESYESFTKYSRMGDYRLSEPPTVSLAIWPSASGEEYHVAIASANPSHLLGFLHDLHFSF